MEACGSAPGDLRSRKRDLEKKGRAHEWCKCRGSMGGVWELLLGRGGWREYVLLKPSRARGVPGQGPTAKLRPLPFPSPTTITPRHPVPCGCWLQNKTKQLPTSAVWSSGMILASGARGLRFNSQNNPRLHARKIFRSSAASARGRDCCVPRPLLRARTLLRMVEAQF